jgi:uridine kinase
MQINYGNYFTELGFKNGLYNAETNEYDREAIISKIKSIEQRWKAKYPEFDFKTEKLKFENKVAFNQSFTTEVEYLNLETK